MLKRFTVALAALFVLTTSAMAAGTIPLSLSQQFDKFGHVLAGCKLNIIQAGTVGTPQIAYQDTALTIPVPGGSQLICDAAGRISQFFLADGNIKVQLTDANGVLQFTADNILVIGNSSGGGGGSPVDPTTILATGDMKVTYGTGILSGFVRANGRTIGSSTSGATERANSDTQALFQYLWGADPNLVVLSGRGASANADWVANKQITLPDWRGRALAGLDDMGNSAAGRLTATYFGAVTGCAATVLGCAGGLESETIITTNLPAYTPSGSITNGAISLFVSGSPAVAGTTIVAAPPGSGGNAPAGGTVGQIVPSQAGSTLNMSPQGGTSAPVAVASPMMLTTVYLKL